MLLAGNIAVEQEVIVAAIMIVLLLCFLYWRVSDVHQYTFIRSPVRTLR